MKILFAFVITCIISGLLGLLISIVSNHFYVEEDDRLRKITEMLPGYNCGACGCPGCKNLAEKIINNKEEVYKCKPLKEEQRNKIIDFIK